MTESSEDKPLVVITGVGGAIGGVLARALRNDYAVVGLDRSDTKAEVPLIPVDLTVDASVDQALTELRDAHGARIASVIHLAGYVVFTGEDHPLYHSLNVDGTRRLLDRLQRFRVEQFIFVSTMLVQRAGGPDECIDETGPLEPKWAYPRSKAEAEAVVRTRNGTIPFLILRLAGLYDDETVVPTLAHQIARIRERDLESHIYAGDRRTRQSMIHHDDLARAVVAAIGKRNSLPEGAVLPLGEPDPPTYQELQDAIGEALHGKDWPTLRVPATVAAAGAWVQEKLLPHLPRALGGTDKPFVRPFMMASANDSYALDGARAEAMLGWTPRRRLQATLPTILHHLKLNPRKWYEQNGLDWPDAAID